MMIHTHTQAAGGYRLQAGGHPYNDRMPGTQTAGAGTGSAGHTLPTICGQALAHGQQMPTICHQLPTACGAVRSRSRRGRSCHNCETQPGRTPEAQEPPQGREAPEHTARTIYTRGHEPRRTEEPPPQVNEDLSGGFYYSSVVVGVWPAVSAATLAFTASTIYLFILTPAASAAACTGSFSPFLKVTTTRS